MADGGLVLNHALCALMWRLRNGPVAMREFRDPTLIMNLVNLGRQKGLIVFKNEHCGLTYRGMQMSLHLEAFDPTNGTVRQ